MATKSSFRIGKVRGDLRGKNWYLTYHENGRRIRPRVGPDRVLDTCDDWQLPLFATLMMTGLRPGELTHLILPDDLDLEHGVLRVRDKPELGWQVKTRTEREIPLMPPLIELLRTMLAGRTSGVAFRRRRFSGPNSEEPRVTSVAQMSEEIAIRVCHAEAELQQVLNRERRSTIVRAVWRDAGLIKTERIRIEFMRLSHAIGAPELTSPKMLRHLFATTLQEGRVDPLIRCELIPRLANDTFVGSISAGLSTPWTSPTKSPSLALPTEHCRAMSRAVRSDF